MFVCILSLGLGGEENAFLGAEKIFLGAENLI